VEEQARVTACKVREVSFWHGADVAPDIFRQVLIMVFLREGTQTGVSAAGLVGEREKMEGGLVGWGHITHLVPKRAEEVLHRSPVVLPELSQVFYKDPI